jgi:hypothetical protein
MPIHRSRVTRAVRMRPRLPELTGYGHRGSLTEDEWHFSLASIVMRATDGRIGEGYAVGNCGMLPIIVWQYEFCAVCGDFETGAFAGLEIDVQHQSTP